MPITVKTINKERYIYFSYYENGKKKEVYCGLASAPESKKKALELEIKHLIKQKKELEQKVSKAESELRQIQQ